jgi:peptidoglycan hydrolase CwlO-like protein
MIRKLLPDSYGLEQTDLESEIFQSLKNIELQLQEELANKQKTIEVSWIEIRNLRAQLDAKDQTILTLQAKISENQRNIEGNRQLINKLLSDLSRLRQDIDWYKRTYENRSLLGVIKDKIKYFFS